MERRQCTQALKRRNGNQRETVRCATQIARQERVVEIRAVAELDFQIFQRPHTVPAMVKMHRSTTDAKCHSKHSKKQPFVALHDVSRQHTFDCYTLVKQLRSGTKASHGVCGVSAECFSVNWGKVCVCVCNVYNVCVNVCRE